jgi:serine protease Do
VVKKSNPGATDSLAGVELETLDGRLRQQLDVPKEIKGGVVIKDVKRGSPAAEAGLRPGDVVIELDRKPVLGVVDFKKAYEKAPKKTLLLVHRRGRTLYIALEK